MHREPRAPSRPLEACRLNELSPGCVLAGIPLCACCTCNRVCRPISVIGPQHPVAFSPLKHGIFGGTNVHVRELKSPDQGNCRGPGPPGRAAAATCSSTPGFVRGLAQLCTGLPRGVAQPSARLRALIFCAGARSRACARASACGLVTARPHRFAAPAQVLG